jgi:hypothetical protein
MFNGSPNHDPSELTIVHTLFSGYSFEKYKQPNLIVKYTNITIQQRTKTELAGRYLSRTTS